MSPTRGPIGKSIVISGRGFGSLIAGLSGAAPFSEPVYLHQYTPDGDDLLVVLGEAKVSKDGSFNLTVTIPSEIGVRQQSVQLPLANGDYQFIVGPTANILDSIFTVTPK